jgi:hypothetical protein
MRQGTYGESGCSNIGAGPAGLMAGKELAEEIGGGPRLVVGVACTFADVFSGARTLKRFSYPTGVTLETISVSQTT